MIRLLNLGIVPALRSQTVYHAVAQAFADDAPDTIILVSPAEPYVCIGYHQDPVKEVNLDYCRAHNLPVYRRQVGGGTVYLDRDQLFTQWVFRREHLPPALDDRFARFVQPLVETYRSLGIDAYHRPINDIQVGGRKIGGTGAMAAAQAEVLVGSLMFDFDTATMSRVLKLSSQKMRDKVYQSLEAYMTTMTRELGQPPARAAATTTYLDHCARLLDMPIVPGVLTEGEEARIAELDRLFSSDAWLYQKGPLKQHGIKIHEDVRVAEAEYKAAGGLIRVMVRLRGEQIDDIGISGDFTILPATAVAALEQTVCGLEAEEMLLRGRLQATYDGLRVESPGVSAADFAAAIMRAVVPLDKSSEFGLH